jgi:hypothetical protein
MDYRLCKNCNNSDTSEVTTSIHTHPDTLIVMLQCNLWNDKSQRINTGVNFPVTRFVPNQGLDNDDMPTEYDLFAAICNIESRNKISGHFTAQCKEIKGSNDYWIKYDITFFELNNFINSRKRTRSKVMYHSLAYFLFYIRRDPAVSPEIGLQVQENNGVSQLHADDHDNEQHLGDLVTNKQQDMSVREDINQVGGTNVGNQSIPKEIIELPMLISHLPIMQMSTPDHDSHLVQSSILMTI